MIRTRIFDKPVSLRTLFFKSPGPSISKRLNSTRLPAQSSLNHRCMGCQFPIHHLGMQIGPILVLHPRARGHDRNIGYPMFAEFPLFPRVGMAFSRSGNKGVPSTALGRC
jgi:hypothetical protein